MKKIFYLILGILILIILAGIFKFNILSNLNGYDVDGNRVEVGQKNLDIGFQDGILQNRDIDSFKEVKEKENNGIQVKSDRGTDNSIELVGEFLQKKTKKELEVFSNELIKKKLKSIKDKIYFSAFPDFGGSEDEVSYQKIKDFENLTGRKIF